MKKIFITILSFQLVTAAISQTKPKLPTQSEINKQIAEAMKDMSPEEQADLKNFKNQVESNKMQLSLNAGVQVPGTFTTQKNLFQ